MTKLLLKLFAPKGDRAAVGKLSGAVGIVCNVLLFAGKLFIGMVSGAVSIMADAMNNLTDAASSIVTLLGFRLAEQPADEEHPYGHARFEYLSGLAVSVMIILIGFELAKSSFSKILAPEPVQLSWPLGAALCLSIGVKLWLGLFNGTLGKLIDSDTLLAAAQDSRNDTISTGAVLAAAVFEKVTRLPVDGWVGMAVSVFILVSGWRLARETISPLLGEAASQELRETITAHIVAHPKVLGYHDLMVHDYGPGQRFASLHVEMDYREDPMHCHEIIDDLERECMTLHGVHLVIHYDPVITDDPELNRLRAVVDGILAELDPRLKSHDFRMVRGTGHTNLVFDVALPGQLRKQERSLKRQLDERLAQAETGTYYTVVTFDSAAFNQ